MRSNKSVRTLVAVVALAGLGVACDDDDDDVDIDDPTEEIEDTIEDVLDDDTGTTVVGG